MDLVRVIDPVDTSQLLVGKIVGLADAKEVLPALDHMIDTLGSPLGRDR
jgi:hypothetical protein